MGKKSIHSFKKTISFENSDRASVVFFISLFLVTITLLVGSSSFANLSTKTVENPLFLNQINKARTFNLFHLLFEINSAFGTTGLSTGILNHLNIYTKILLIVIMFIGQLGISSSILIW
ncbi:potassium uptake protein, TrkH family, partial [Mesomycoplasma hyorhinis]